MENKNENNARGRWRWKTRADYSLLGALAALARTNVLLVLIELVGLPLTVLNAVFVLWYVVGNGGLYTGGSAVQLLALIGATAVFAVAHILCNAADAGEASAWMYDLRVRGGSPSLVLGAMFGMLAWRVVALAIELAFSAFVWAQWTCGMLALTQMTLLGSGERYLFPVTLYWRDGMDAAVALYVAAAAVRHLRLWRAAVFVFPLAYEPSAPDSQVEKSK